MYIGISFIDNDYHYILLSFFRNNKMTFYKQQKSGQKAAFDYHNNFCD
ncbi:hypothetical protein PFLA_a3997 [Pseudoalteromonas flavipulchra NCIMB 2033 = ATCC BAA-314]|nr:hypothetical protein [Pseudoalteromonas flavipulchra NCIMB 2033 = ATCC BAA-314]